MKNFKQMSKSLIKLLVFAMVLLFFMLNITCFANSEENDVITNDFELNLYSSMNNVIQYGVMVNENDIIQIKAEDYNLPSNLYDYKDDIRLRITYLKENYKVLECKVVDFKNNEIIEDLSEENINKLFNIEYGKNITEKNWVNVVKLSELNENNIYKYTAIDTVQFPEIENDIEKNCIIYIKEKDDSTYEKNIDMYKKISGGSLSLSFNEYNSGETFKIMYKTVENEELLKLIKEDEIIYLSQYNDGDALKYGFENYIYNNTENNITINIKDLVFGVEKTDSIEIEKGKIYGFDWQIDSASISYKKNDTEQSENKEDKKDNEQQKGEVEKDKTTTSSPIPKAGIKSSIILVIILIFAIMVVVEIELKKIKDIK